MRLNASFVLVVFAGEWQVSRDSRLCCPEFAHVFFVEGELYRPNLEFNNMSVGYRAENSEGNIN